MELQADAVAVRFNRLIKYLLEGDLKRNSFQSWEIQILLDVQRCRLPNARFRRVILRYQRYVNRRLFHGAPAPPTLSEYLQHCQESRPAPLH